MLRFGDRRVRWSQGLMSFVRCERLTALRRAGSRSSASTAPPRQPVEVAVTGPPPGPVSGMCSRPSSFDEQDIVTRLHDLIAGACSGARAVRGATTA